jgi:3-oxoacyl-[acyl-carrier protein] reductase
MSEKQFDGKSAIVTGGTRGIGKAIVLELARRGANVAFNYSKSADEAEKLKAEIEALGNQSQQLEAENAVDANEAEPVDNAVTSPSEVEDDVQGM